MAPPRSDAAKANRKLDVGKVKVDSYKTTFMASISRRLPDAINNTDTSVTAISSKVTQIYSILCLNVTKEQFGLHKQPVTSSNRLTNLKEDDVRLRTDYNELNKICQRDHGLTTRRTVPKRIGDMKTLYNITRTLCGKSTYTNSPILSSSSSLLTAPHEQLVR